MWKVGDKIKFIKEGVHDSTISHGLIIGKIYKIVLIDHVSNNSYYSNGNGYKFCIQKGNTQWWIEPKSFRLIRDNLSEVECLDAFRENFKDGV